MVFPLHEQIFKQVCALEYMFRGDFSQLLHRGCLSFTHETFYETMEETVSIRWDLLQNVPIRTCSLCSLCWIMLRRSSDFWFTILWLCILLLYFFENHPELVLCSIMPYHIQEMLTNSIRVRTTQ